MVSHRHIFGLPAEDTRAAAGRDAYLDAARECILDVGWRRTTLTEVARRGGVSRMTIYRAWADMPTLLGDLMTREWVGILTRVTGGVRVKDDQVGRLPSDIVELVRALRASELFVRIVELDPELILPYLLARRGRSQDAILELVEGVVRAGQATGAIRAGNPTAITRALVLAAHGFVISVQTMLDDGVREADLDGELGRLVAGLLAP